MSDRDVLDLEPELRRRLGDVAATTTTDEAAWDAIQDRIAARPAPAHGSRRARLLAVVAAAVLVVVAAVALSHQDDSDKIQTDNTPSTTIDRTTTTDRTTSTNRTTTSTTSRAGSTSTTGVPGQGPGGGTTPEGGVNPAGGGTDPGAGGATATTAPPATAPDNTRQDGRVPVVSLAGSGYTMELTAWQSGGSNHLNVFGPTTDAYQTTWSWPNPVCLAGLRVEVAGTDNATHSFFYGYVTADAAEVLIVTTGGLSTSARLGPEVFSGQRPWIGEEPPGQVDHLEARDGSGGLLYNVAAPTWDGGC